MAKRAVTHGQLTPDLINSGERFRVRYPSGIFSIAPRPTPYGTYLRVSKRVDKRLFRATVGKVPHVTRDMIHKSAMALLLEIQAETGRTFPRDNRARGHIAAQVPKSEGTDYPFAQLAQAAAGMLRDHNDKAARQARGETVTMHGHPVACTRIEPGTRAMAELIEGALERLPPGVTEWYLLASEQTLDALEREAAALAEGDR